MKSIFEPNSDPAIVPSAPATGTLEVFWTADERLTSPYRWNYFYRFDASSCAEPALESLRVLDHATVVEQAKGFGFTAVTKRQRDLHLQWITQLDAISRTPIGGRPLREWLRFEGISLWHFLPEVCYLGSAAPLQETVELIEYLTDLIERFRPSRLVLAARWNDHQKGVVSLISQRYEIPIECCQFQAVSTTVEKKPKTSRPDDPFRSLEEGQPAAVREYVSSLRRAQPSPPLGDQSVLLLSFPRAWTRTQNQGRIDSYYEPFRPFFQERGLSPVRVELPYYFQIREGIKSYIDSVTNPNSGDWPTIFLDEYNSETSNGFARQCQIGLQQAFQGLIQSPEFHKAISWKGISLVSSLISFWQRTFVDHLALRCIPAMMMARRVLDTLRPRAILAVYEIGFYARAMIIEAHRRGIPSLGLQHAFIHPEHEYYLHDDIVVRPDLTTVCDGRIIPTKTLLFGPDAQQTLTRRGHYPVEATEVIGCDWRCLGQSPAFSASVQDLKAKWVPSGRKIALVISQPSLTYGILHQLIGKLSASEYAILIKLHPDDKADGAYRRLLTDHGFEVCLLRDYLKESIQAADLVFTSIFSTAGLESLFWGKSVSSVRDLDLPYSVPWDRFTTDLSSIDGCQTTIRLPKPGADLEQCLKTLGYDRAVTHRDFTIRLHSIFDEFEKKAKPQEKAEPESVREFRNDLYRRSEVNYDNYFQKTSDAFPADAAGPLIRQVQRVSFQLSNLCNYASIHTRCPLHGQTAKQVLPAGVVRDTIGELGAVGFDGVIAFHIYNEPLNDPRLFSFIEYSRHVCPGGRVLILTNGFYLTQIIADELAALGIWNLAVSAYSQSEYDRLAGLQVKVPYKVFLARLDGRLDQYDRPPMDLSKPCMAPVRDLSIGPDGSVILCCLDWKQFHVFGNLKLETLSSILSKESIRSAYRDLLGGNRSLHLCRRCDWVR
jgi:hypothetical protein